MEEKTKGVSITLQRIKYVRWEGGKNIIVSSIIIYFFLFKTIKTDVLAAQRVGDDLYKVKV